MDFPTIQCTRLHRVPPLCQATVHLIFCEEQSRVLFLAGWNAVPNPSAVQAGTGHSSRVPCSSRWCWHMCCSDLENRAQESRHGLLKVTHFSHTVSSGRCPTQSHLGWKGVNYCIYCLNGVHNLIQPLKEDVSFSSWKSSFPINSLNYSPLVYHFTATSRVLSWTQ